MTTTTDKTYLISNEQRAVRLSDDEIYKSTWILFAETPVIEVERSGFDLSVPRIEVYKYISGPGATQTKSKVATVDEARAEWRFWISQGFQRITDATDKGWKYTEDIRNRVGINKLSPLMKSEKSEICKKIVAECSDINESEVA